jgi:signal transduction histidine kinase
MRSFRRTVMWLIALPGRGLRVMFGVAWRWIGGACLAGTFLLAAPETAAAQPRQVLLLHSFGPQFAPWSAISARFREELVKQSKNPIDLYEASIQNERLIPSRDDGPFIQYLRALFSERGPDLVVTMGAPAARFIQRSRPQIFPSTPLLIAAADVSTFDEAALAPTDTTVAVAFDHEGLIENILQVLPDTANIAVVIGDSPLERFWVRQLHRDFQPFTGRVKFDWFNELPVEEMLKRVRNLPPRSAIYYATVRVDAHGVPQEDDHLFAQLRAAAPAPIFTYIDTGFGNGIVGGPMFSVAQIARESAGAAIRILNGERPDGVKTPPLRFAAPTYDWRELQRWNISESALPPGSIVQFRQPTVWEQYRSQILAVCAALLLQAALISWLLYERRHRLRSQAATLALSGRLIHAQEEERSRLARELHDDVTQQLALLAIDAGQQERNLPGPAGAVMQSLREGLIRLSQEVHALSYRLHPSILEDLGLVEALKSECDRFSRTYPIRLKLELGPVPEKLPRDVALCLFRIVQEGLRNVARHSAASQAEVSLRRLPVGLQLVVWDNGRGFERAQHRAGTSLGHAGMQQRAFLVGGKVDIISSPGNGTTILVWVPSGGNR